MFQITVLLTGSCFLLRISSKIYVWRSEIVYGCKLVLSSNLYINLDKDKVSIDDMMMIVFPFVDVFYGRISYSLLVL